MPHKIPGLMTWFSTGLLSLFSLMLREIKGEFVTEPLIYRGLLADVNVRYQGIGTQTPIFISVANVRVIPGMTIIWTGSILVVIGIVPLLSWGKRTES